MNFFKKIGVIFVSCLALIASSCNSSSSSSTTTTDSGTTTADVSSISNVPTLNLSSYDNTTSTSGTASVNSAFLSASDDESLDPNYSIGDSAGAEGSRSIAYCEINMHKEEIYRESGIMAADLCRVRALEEAGVITIPNDGTRAIFHFDMSGEDFEETEEEKAAECDDIDSEEFPDEYSWCLEDEEDESFLLRVGIINDALEIDFCTGANGSEVLEIESTYAASTTTTAGDTYVVSAIEHGDWGGGDNWIGINATISGFEAVENGEVTFGADSSLGATMTTYGNWGNGTIGFEAHGAKGSGYNVVRGIFEASYEDGSTGTTQEFTGKAYAQYGGADNVGTAKMSFTGTVPPFPVSDIFPYDLEVTEDTIAAFGAELGISGLTSESLLCPNMSDDFEEGENVKPMVLATDGVCPSFTHEETESFAITNAVFESDFGGSEVIQTATVIDDASSPFFDTVSAFDISTLSVASQPEFSRAWDCTGTATEVAFDSFTEEDMITMDETMMECDAIEEVANALEGAGGHDCFEDQNAGEVDNWADEGVSEDSWGVVGGDYTTTSSMAQCKSGDTVIGEVIFMDPVDTSQNLYCLIDEDGVCNEFTYNSSSKSAAGLNLNYGGGVTVTSMSFTVTNDVATAAYITLNVPGLGSCTNSYTVEQPTFEGAADEGDGDYQGFPTPCSDAGITEEDACKALCDDLGGDACMM